MSSKVLLRRKMLWFIDFFFNGYVEDLIWHWFLIWQRCCGADLILISCGRRCWGWFGVDFSLKKIYLILRLIWNRFLIFVFFYWGWYYFIFLVVEGVAAGQPASQESQAGGSRGSSPGELSWSGFEAMHHVSARASCYIRPPRLKYIFPLQ